MAYMGCETCSFDWASLLGELSILVAVGFGGYLIVANIMKKHKMKQEVNNNVKQRTESVEG